MQLDMQYRHAILVIFTSMQQPGHKEPINKVLKQGYNKHVTVL